MIHHQRKVRYDKTVKTRTKGTNEYKVHPTNKASTASVTIKGVRAGTLVEALGEYQSHIIHTTLKIFSTSQPKYRSAFAAGERWVRDPDGGSQLPS